MPARLASPHCCLQTALLAALALVSLLSSLAETASPEARALARTLLVEYREKPDDFPRRLEIVEAIVDLSRDLGVNLLDYLDSRWQIEGPAYEEAMTRAIESEAKKRKDSPILRSQTKASRKILLDLLEQGDALGKDALRDEGWPAMQRLRALYEVKPESVLRNVCHWPLRSAAWKRSWLNGPSASRISWRSIDRPSISSPSIAWRRTRPISPA